MKTTVINFPKKKNCPRTVQDMAYILTREIMREYASAPAHVVEKAVTAAVDRMNTGGGLVDAMDTANITMLQNSGETWMREEAMRNFERLMLFRRRRDRLTDALMNAVEVCIRRRMQGAAESEIMAAVDRARRVLQGGGDTLCALYHALPDDLPGGV